MADRSTAVRAVAAAALLLASAGGGAQALSDPTRPPLELIAPAATGPGGVGAPAHPRLESILLSSTRKGAIISGQYVPLGGKFGKASLVKINATEVILEKDEGPEVLQLFPSVQTPAPGAETKPEKAVKRP